MAMNYTTLTGARTVSGSISNWVNKTIPADDILTEAQQMIYERLRRREMIAVSTGTATQSSTSIPLPERYLETFVLQMTYPDQYSLVQWDIATLDANRIYQSTTPPVLSTGVPTVFAVAGTMAEFPIAVDTSRAWFWRYFEQPAQLSTDNETNWVTQKAPRLIRAACLVFANEYLKDKSEREHWIEVAETEITKLNAEDDLAMRNAVIVRDTSQNGAGWNGPYGGGWGWV